MDLTRITQLITRLVATMLVGKAGMDAATANSIALPAAELAGAVIAFTIDLLLHSKRWEALMGSEENSKLETRNSKLAPVLVVALLALALGGCWLVQPTPLTPGDQAIADVVTMEQAYTAELIAIAAVNPDPETYARVFKPLDDALMEALTAARAAAKAGMPMTVAEKQVVFNAALQKFIAARMEYQRSKQTP